MEAFDNFQLIDKEGVFNTEGLENFVMNSKLVENELEYDVISIIGPQGSGKSTILNHLYGSQFETLDAKTGRHQTTTGIWMGKCLDTKPYTVVIDVEGCDGTERGEDDMTFERQSALFALAISDVIILNLWYSDVGREYAGCNPLLKDVLKVMIRLFGDKKKTLVFAIRDTLEEATPEMLCGQLREKLEKIWSSLPNQERSLEDFLHMEVFFLPHYIYCKDNFKTEVRVLKDKLYQIARVGVPPSSSLRVNLPSIWKTVKEVKDLDIPSLTVMLATIRCDERVDQKYMQFVCEKNWVQLRETLQSKFVPGFNDNIHSLINNCLSEYDTDTINYDEGVRLCKREILEKKLLNLSKPACDHALDHLLTLKVQKMLRSFEVALARGQMIKKADFKKSLMNLFSAETAGSTCKSFDYGSYLDKVSEVVDKNLAEFQSAKQAQLVESYELKVKHGLQEPLKSLLHGCPGAGANITWSNVWQLLDKEIKSITLELCEKLAGLDLADSQEDVVAKVKEASIKMIEAKTKALAVNVLDRMMERFIRQFDFDASGLKRRWTVKDDVEKIHVSARTDALKLLSIVVAFRLENSTDQIEDRLVEAFADPSDKTASLHVGFSNNDWDQIERSKTFITPNDCRLLWEAFQTKSMLWFSKAMEKQELDLKNQPNSSKGFMFLIAALSTSAFIKDFMGNPWLMLGLLFLVFFFLHFLSAVYQKLQRLAQRVTTFISFFQRWPMLRRN